jgi:hypothetical protein
MMTHLECIVGSAERAEEMVNSQQILPLHPSLLSLLLPDSISDSSTDPATDGIQHCHFPEHVFQAVCKYKQLYYQHGGMDEAGAELWVQSLEADECAYLLHVWLASLAAKDASAVIRLPQFQHAGAGAGVGVAVGVLANESLPGTGSVSGTSSKSQLQFQYQQAKVTLIDIGPKPVSKIRQRVREEEGICLRALAAAEELKKKGLTCQISNWNFLD